MRLFFGDDSRQSDPDLEGMGSLVGSGGFLLPGRAVNALERGLESICEGYGFPDGEEFKWSPDRDLWMRDNLVDENRTQFFIDCIRLLKDLGGRTLVILEDENRSTATDAPETEIDVAALMFERIETWLQYYDEDGILVVDRPSGGRADEDSFLEETLALVQQGTDYVNPERIAINALSTSSEYVRNLQLADVIISSACARVAGEDTFSPPIFAKSSEVMMQRKYGSTEERAGVGLKIYPETQYANLYHWLLEEERWRRNPTMATPLPSSRFPYEEDPYQRQR